MQKNLVSEIIFDMSKNPQFFVLADFKVAPAKFFNFHFHCKPSLSFDNVVRKIRKTLSKLRSNPWDTLYLTFFWPLDSMVIPTKF